MALQKQLRLEAALPDRNKGPQKHVDAFGEHHPANMHEGEAVQTELSAEPVTCGRRWPKDPGVDAMRNDKDSIWRRASLDQSETNPVGRDMVVQPLVATPRLRWTQLLDIVTAMEFADQESEHWMRCGLSIRHKRRAQFREPRAAVRQGWDGIQPLPLSE